MRKNRRGEIVYPHPTLGYGPASRKGRRSNNKLKTMIGFEDPPPVNHEKLLSRMEFLRKYKLNPKNNMTRRQRHGKC